MASYELTQEDREIILDSLLKKYAGAHRVIYGAGRTVGETRAAFIAVADVKDEIRALFRTRSEGAEPETEDFGPICAHCDEIVEDCSCERLLDAISYVAENIDTLRSRLRSAAGPSKDDPWTIDCDPRRDVAPDENIQIVDAEGVTVCFMSNGPNRNHIRDAERIVGRPHPMYAERATGAEKINRSMRETLRTIRSGPIFVADIDHELVSDLHRELSTIWRPRSSPARGSDG